MDSSKESDVCEAGDPIQLIKDDLPNTREVSSPSRNIAFFRDEIPVVIRERLVTFSKLAENVTIELGDKPHNAEDRTSETPLSERDLLLAATLVIDAKNGHHSDFKLTDQSVRLYLIYHHWGLRYLLIFFIVLHHMVAVCEEPALEGFQLPFWVTVSVELACLLFYLFRLLHCASFLPPEKFWRDKKNVLVISVMLLTVIDMSCYVGLKTTGYGEFAYRWTRALRPVFMINFSENKQVRRAFRNIRKTLPDILNVLILFFLSISLFSLMAQKLFQKRSIKFPDGTPYFVNYMDIYFDLYVLVTTANNPDIMMPAFDSSRWFAFFFISYLIICLYIFMNIFLAVIYNNYRKHLKNEVRKLVYMKRQSLAKAFDFLKIKVNQKFVLDFRRFNILLKMIPPVRSPMMVSILWFVLDSDGDNEIGKADFLQLADLLNVAVSEIKDRKNIFDKLIPTCYSSRYSKMFKKIIAHRYFRYFFDIMILLNAFLIAFDVSEAEWFFLVLFTFEIIAKMYTFGIKYFFKRFWNIFDFVVIGAAVVGTAVETIMDKDADDKTRTLDILLVLRVLRLVKIIGGIERFQVIVVTIMNLGPSILTYGGVLCVVYYMFAIIGMELFQNRITYHGYENVTESLLYCGNPRLNGSLFYQSHYCSNNFNNLLSSFVVLFELMVVNQWHVIASGFVLTTTKAARAYFFIFHLSCVIIVLNIFTAFVLEAFILEYSLCKSKLESAMEKKIMEMGLQLGRSRSQAATETDKDQLVTNNDDDFIVDSDHDFHADSDDDVKKGNSTLPNLSHETDIRFHLSKSKNVENLLQRMFENELDVEDIGPPDIENFGEEGISKQITLDTL